MILDFSNEFKQALDKFKFAKSMGESKWELNLISEKAYYVELEKKNIDIIKNMDKLIFLVDSDIFCSGFIIYYDINGNKIDGQPCVSYKEIFLEIPNEARDFVLALRLKNNRNITLHSIVLGQNLAINEFICEKFSFVNNFVESKVINKSIIMETVFCDIEKDRNILNRYFSYLKTQIKVVSSWEGLVEFIWVIHISNDKVDYINLLLDLIDGVTNVHLNIYEHKNQIVNESSKIDLIKKPNMFGGNYERIFKSFIDKIKYNYDGKIVVRVGLDDDDFISKLHIDKIYLSVNKYLDSIMNEEQIFIGFLDVNVAYHYLDGRVNVDSIIMSKCMTGNRFSVCYNNIPSSPFSISEDFYNPNNKNYYIFYSEVPTFFYNRHGINLSKNNKYAHYEKIIKNKVYDTKEDYLRGIVNY